MSTPALRRLEEWEATYSGRRTVAAEMLERATWLTRDAIAEAVAEYRGRIEMLEEQHAQAIERAQIREDQAKGRAERAEQSLKAYREQQTNLREQRETVNDGVQVRISAPRVPSYGDREVPRPWTLGELETVIYRLRSGGAVDDTEVRFAREHVEACIPFPEMVLEPRRTSAPAPVEPRSLALADRLTRPVLWAGLVAAVLAVVGIVAAVVL